MQLLLCSSKLRAKSAKLSGLLNCWPVNLDKRDPSGAGRLNSLAFYHWTRLTTFLFWPGDSVWDFYLMALRCHKDTKLQQGANMRLETCITPIHCACGFHVGMLVEPDTTCSSKQCTAAPQVVKNSTGIPVISLLKFHFLKITESKASLCCVNLSTCHTSRYTCKWLAVLKILRSQPRSAAFTACS